MNSPALEQPIETEALEEKPPARLSRNVATTIAAQLLTWAMSFAVVLYLPAYVGPSGMGKLSLTGAFGAILAAVIPLGTSMVLVKETARNPARAMPLMVTALMLRLPMSLAGIIAAYVAARVMRLDSVSTTLVLVYSGGAVIVVLNDAVGSTLQGLERLPRQNAGALVEKLTWAVLTIAVVAAHGRLWQIAIVAWISSTFALACNLAAFSKDIRAFVVDPLLGKGEMGRCLAEAKSMLSMGLPFLGWSLCIAMYGQTDPMVIHAVTGRDQDIGWYGVTTRLVGTTLFLPGALMAALLPRLSRLYQKTTSQFGTVSPLCAAEGAEFLQLSKKALSIALLCGMPIALVLGVMPGRVLHMLPYGAKFDAAAQVLRIGGPCLLLWYAGILLGAFVIARDGQKRMFRAAAIAAIVSIPLCALFSRLTLAWTGNAATGAIASDCLIELYLVICYARMLPVGIVDGRLLGFAARCAAAALATTACLALVVKHGTPHYWGGGAGAGLLSIVPCAILYLVLCRVLRCIEPSDIAMIRGLISRRPNEAGENVV